MATIGDVAKMAGVSAMTVSRYINQSGYVSAQTGRRIEEAVQALGFRSNLVARSLVTKKTKTIGLVVASIADPFYPDLVRGVEDEAYARGYNVILCNADGKQKENAYIDVLYDRYVDGIIFAHLNIDETQLGTMDSKKVGCVLIDNERDADGVAAVKTDDVLGGYLAAGHLAGLGHRRIGLIHGSLCGDRPPGRPAGYRESFQFRVWNSRTKGYREALREHGLEEDGGLMAGGGELAGANEAELGYNAMKLLMKRPAPPTAVYAQSDLMAIGAMRAVLEAGARVPGDFSVMGHDGLPLGEMLWPRLSTVVQPRYEIGKAGAAALVDAIEKGERRVVCLGPRLAVRESTAAPRRE